MKHHSLVSVSALAIAIAVFLPEVVGARAGAGADGWTAPRTADGQPDLQGVWANNSATPFERPKAFAGKETLTEEEIADLGRRAAELREGEQAGNLLGDFLIQKVLEDPEFRGFDQDTGNYNSFWLVEREFDQRTSVVVDPPDGRIPPLTPQALKKQVTRAAYRREHPADGPEDFSLGHRCVNFGVPKVGSGYNSYQHIFQTPRYVVILSEMAHDARIIPIDGRRHLPDTLRQWNGDPRGRWDGDTLVVETRNFSARSQFRGSNENLRLVERFTRSSDDTLVYEVTITDPTTWTRPWTARIPLQRSDDPLFEYACHEGNYAMAGSLGGARVQEEAAHAEPVATGSEIPDSVAEADVFLLTSGEHPSEWRTHGGTYAEQRHSTLAQIDEHNVSNLGLAWTFNTETTRGLEATPIVVDGTLYATVTWSRVFALDARTGEKKWEWDPEVDRAYGRRACCDVVNRGVAYYDGRVYVGILDGRLAALDAATGEVVWEVLTADQSQPYTITGAPRVIRGKVIIGNGGAEYGVRGYVSAYDAATGELVWRFYTVPGNPADGFESAAMEKAAETWKGEWWTMGGGGTVWDSMAYDAELDLLYIGTGNGSPWNREVRSPGGGDNLYLSSIVALRADTGEYVWHYQTTPGDSWDYTATQHIILADLGIDGETRKVLMQAPKNGFFFVLDRASGELISAEKYVDITWATHVDETGRPVEAAGARYETEPFLLRPSALGGHNWQPMSFSPASGLVYIPAQLNSMYLAPPSSFKFVPDRWNLGVGMRPVPPELDEGPPSGHLLAWDPVAQTEAWRVPRAVMWNGGLLSTAGNLVFQGTGERRFVAYRATDGEKLWEVPTSVSILGSPVTYDLDGTQYVSVLAGWGGAFGLGGSDALGRVKRSGWILTFALAGSAAMPESTARGLRPPSAISFEASADRIAAGSALYEEWCSVCHGTAGRGGGALPDLRYSAPRVFDSYSEILLEGRLLEVGMPIFDQFLAEEEVAAIRGFVLSERSKLIDGR